ncbi:MAG TPA: lysylphosphatidylglycerol synthase transmembrane domain-containing protein [Ferruginibacter sp.]|nr:lysylphosphatidylglycerol synthase transmembrane domain-containing protein [Ferruginibacter sp.]HRE62165.1 lysylphosphatidylglycerol synthase transmembrane domain-containing protein [Ferruginibacter sp.]
MLLGISLYKQIIAQPDLEERWGQIQQSWHQGLFWVSILLMFANWGVEAWKWRIQLAPLEKISFLKAFKSVMAGCSITMLTPNRVGEFGGRILYVQEKYRLRAITLTILGSISQFLVTLIMGSLGLLIMKFYSGQHSEIFKTIPGLISNSLLIASVLITIFTLMFYLRIGWLIHLLERVNFLSKALKYVKLLENFTAKQLLTILILSFVRYLIFILQYILLLDVLGVEVSYQLSFWLLTIFYLIMAMAPTIGFTELPVRATASVELFKLYSSNIVGIQAAALGIWIINLVIPAIIGSLLIFGIKITKDDA